MPKKGDSYTITLQEAHLKWGEHRHTSSRGIVYGEGYLPIPLAIAKNFDIYMSNHPTANTIYKCTSRDGFLNDSKLKAAGNVKGGDHYAKQFQGKGDLQILGDWFNHVNAQVGDEVEIYFDDSDEITIAKL